MEGTRVRTERPSRKLLVPSIGVSGQKALRIMVWIRVTPKEGEKWMHVERTRRRNCVKTIV